MNDTVAATLLNLFLTLTFLVLAERDIYGATTVIGQANLDLHEHNTERTASTNSPEASLALGPGTTNASLVRFAGNVTGGTVEASTGPLSTSIQQQISAYNSQLITSDTDMQLNWLAAISFSGPRQSYFSAGAVVSDVASGNYNGAYGDHSNIDSFVKRGVWNLDAGSAVSIYASSSELNSPLGSNPTESSPGSSVAVVVWSINQPLPGATKQRPILLAGGFMAAIGKKRDGGRTETSQPANGTAVNLVGPVSSDFGQTTPIYAGGSAAPITGIDYSHPVNEFTFDSVGDPNFTSFVIPDAFDGSDTYTIKFAGQTRTAHAGDTIDFTTVDPLGIESFQVSRITPITTDPSGAPSFVWGATYSESGVAGVNVTSLPGDFNHDGVVDASDYVVWRADANTNVTRFTGADADGSGVIDQADFDIWRAHFGQGPFGTPATGTSISASVPEPATLLLLLPSLFFVPTRCRQ